MENSKYQIIKDCILFLSVGILIYLLMSGNIGRTNHNGNNDTTIVYQHTTIIKDTSINQGLSTPAPKVYINNNINQDSLLALLKSFQSKNNNVQLNTDCKVINTYADTLQNDTNAFVAIYDTTQGQLLARRKNIKVFNKTILVDKVIKVKEPKTWHLHTGAYVGLNEISPTVILTAKNRFEIGAGYNILLNQPKIYMGFQIK